MGLGIYEIMFWLCNHHMSTNKSVVVRLHQIYSLSYQFMHFGPFGVIIGGWQYRKHKVGTSVLAVCGFREDGGWRLEEI